MGQTHSSCPHGLRPINDLLVRRYPLIVILVVKQSEREKCLDDTERWRTHSKVSEGMRTHSQRRGPALREGVGAGEAWSTSPTPGFPGIQEAALGSTDLAFPA